MSPALIIHKVKNGFLVAEHTTQNGYGYVELAEARIAASAHDLIEHIEAHFRHAPPPPPMLSTDAILPGLAAARAALDEPAEAPTPATVVTTEGAPQ